VIAGI